MAGRPGPTEAGDMENILNPVELELNRSGRISARQRRHLWRQAIPAAVATAGMAAMAIGGLLQGFDVGFAVFALVPLVFSTFAFARRALAACQGGVSSVDGWLEKRMERDQEDGTSYWFLMEGGKFSVGAGEFWRLPEGGPYRLWFSSLTRSVLNVAPLAGWQPAPVPAHSTSSEVLSISPAEEPRPPVAYDLRPAAQGGWLFGVELRQWWFRPGELMTRTTLARDRGWTRLAHPRLRVDEERMGGEVQTTLQVSSDGGTRQIGSATSEPVAGASTPLLQLGRFMAAQTGLPLEVHEQRAFAEPRKRQWKIEIGG
jgi:hypothetical protein